MRRRDLLIWGPLSVALTILGLSGIPDDAANWMRWLKAIQPYVNHDVTRWLFVLTAWGVLYPLLLWPGRPPAAHDPAVAGEFPYPVELRQIPMDRRFERAKEAKAEEERARKSEVAGRLIALRNEGLRQTVALDASLEHHDSGLSAVAQLLDWVDVAQAGIAEWISPSAARWVVGAPFEGAPNGLEASMRNVVRTSPPDMLRCARAILKRLDETLRDSERLASRGEVAGAPRSS